VAFGLNQGVNLAIVAVSDDLGVGGASFIECADHFGLAAPAAPLRNVLIPGKSANWRTADCDFFLYRLQVRARCRSWSSCRCRRK
jgi:hypothetical protein